VIALFANLVNAGAIAQPAAIVLLKADLLASEQLPAFLALSPGNLLQTRKLRDACVATSRGSAHRWLMFDVATDACEALPFGALGWRPGRFDALAGEAVDARLRADMSRQGYAVITAGTRPGYAKYVCGCPENRSPVGAVECPAQTATPARSIAPIVFLAADEDGDNLSSSFTHTRDSGVVQAGVAAGLSSACVAAAGALQCTVSGLAQGPAAALQLNWLVGDGLASLTLAASIQLVPGPIGSLLFDGFEVTSCP
jgi:hypothetical protein